MSAAIKGIRIKLKPDCVGNAKEWAATINARKPEAVVSLRNEGITLEVAFLDHIAGADYLVYIMKGDLQKSKSVATASQSPIDAYHTQFKQCWESKDELETLIWLDADGN